MKTNPYPHFTRGRILYFNDKDKAEAAQHAITTLEETRRLQIRDIELVLIAGNFHLAQQKVWENFFGYPHPSHYIASLLQHKAML